MSQLIVQTWYREKTYIEFWNTLALIKLKIYAVDGCLISLPFENCVEISNDRPGLWTSHFGTEGVSPEVRISATEPTLSCDPFLLPKLVAAPSFFKR